MAKKAPSKKKKSAAADRPIPDFFDEDGDVSEEYRVVDSFSDWGVYVELYECDGAYVLHQSAVEEGDDFYEELGRITLEEASGRAEGLLQDEIIERGLVFDSWMGLRNLADDECFSVPDEAEYKEYWRTEHWYIDIARIDVYRWKSEDGVRWLAVDEATQLVVGIYLTKKEMVKARVIEPGVGLFDC